MATNNRRLVLLALADNANDEGVAWPATATLAAKCALKERATQAALAALVAAGEIEVLIAGGAGVGATTVYGVVVGMSDAERAAMAASAVLDELRIRRSRGKGAPSHHGTKAKGAALCTPRQGCAPMHPHETEGCIDAHPKGADPRTPGVQPYAPNPSEEPPEEPSSSSSSELTLKSRTSADDDKELIIASACQLLGQADLARLPEHRRAQVGDPEAWVAEATRRRYRRHRAQAAALVVAGGLDAGELARRLDAAAFAPIPVQPLGPIDATQAASEALYERNARRARGQTCPRCDDSGIELTDAGAVVCDHRLMPTSC